MKFNLEDLYNQAEEDAVSVEIPQPLGMCIIANGVKIQKFSDRIEMLNMSKGGSYYQEMTEDEYMMFYENGWRAGGLALSMKNCLHKLGLIEIQIQKELNTRKNDKHMHGLKSRRATLLLKYADLKLKFNSNK
jgi:hypothetical protein|tara:strand:+ start:1500 stop:1898 length:399 start_codon:yes stop_codon:yes gene_type:complete